MEYDVQEMRNKIQSYVTWEKETKKELFHQIIGILRDKEELVLTVQPKGCVVNDIKAVKKGIEKGTEFILYRTKNREYDERPRPAYAIYENVLALNDLIDLYEAIIETLKS